MGLSDLIQVTVCFKYPRRIQIYGNARWVKADEGMVYIYFDAERTLAYPLRDILYIESEPVKEAGEP